MFVPLRKFSTVEELAPVLAHGGTITIELIVCACVIFRGDDPWEIHIPNWHGMAEQREDLLHEFIHLYHHSLIGYETDPRETRFFHEKETERHTKRMLKRQPDIVDELVSAIKASPTCRVVYGKAMG